MIREVARAEQVPLIDYHEAILVRAPNGSWNGTEVFKEGDEYEVPRLIAGDGVHPSNPTAWRLRFDDDALQKNGYVLRNYLTLHALYAVHERVLRSRSHLALYLGGAGVGTLAFGLAIWLVARRRALTRASESGTHRRTRNRA